MALNRKSPHGDAVKQQVDFFVTASTVCWFGLHLMLRFMSPFQHFHTVSGRHEAQMLWGEPADDGGCPEM